MRGGIHTLSACIFAFFFGALGLCSSAAYTGNGRSSKIVPLTLADMMYKRQSPGDTIFNWTAIEPSSTLKWTTCFDTFECARFAVPLDYNDTSGGEAAIAIARLPSPAQPGQDDYKGPLLINPGGPGGSGVVTILENGAELRALVGDGFDLVGFDPRGVGFTTPGLFVFQEGPEDAIQLIAMSKAANETEGSVGTLFAGVETIAKVAEARIPNIGPFVNTPNVARDMLSFVNASGFDKLQYWGFSYGSVIGATFAAMFPDNVGRLIIDGVVDSELYYAGQYSHDIENADKVLDIIYQACVDAGPSVCPIYESSTEKISSRVNKLVDSLKIQPISFFNATTNNYGILDYSSAKGAILSVLYKPYDPQFGGAPLLFALAAAEQGDGLPLYSLNAGSPTSSQYTCPATPPISFASGIENIFAIRCGDTPRPPFGLDGLKALYAEMAQDSQFFSEVWTLDLGCSGWTIKAKELLISNFHITTSFPLLIIGNTADPVTPISSARKMSELFTNSVLLTQDGAGHTSIAANSTCTDNVVRSYFLDGKLPEKGTVCDIQSTIFFSN